MNESTGDCVVDFRRSVKRCEKLVDMLECEMYHSRYRYGGKSEGLASWRAGDNKVTVATSVGQESGRAGRKAVH